MSYLDDPEIVKAALIIIGNEILSGRTQDTNTVWIAENLSKRGISLIEIRVVPDIEASIIRAVNELRERVDYVFTTGGIGPTHDDITAQCMAKAFGLPYERNEDAYKILEDYYGAAEVTPARAKMAMMPRGVKLIPNPVSGAPGFVVGNVHVMAGVPRIMQAMLDHVLETLAGGKIVLSNTISCRLPESILAEPLSDLQTRFKGVDIGSYPHFRGGLLGLSLVLRATDAAILKDATRALVVLIRQLGDEPRALGLQVAVEDLL